MYVQKLKLAIRFYYFVFYTYTSCVSFYIIHR